MTKPNRINWFYHFLSLIVGACLTFTYAPYHLSFLTIPCLAAWLYISLFKSRSPVLNAWWFGLGFFGSGISWVHVSIADFGGLPLIGSIALMLLLCGYLALFPALSVYLFKKLDSYLDSFKAKFIHAGVLMAICWTIAEWCRANFLTGFPWLSVGYSQTNTVFNTWFAIVGEIGLSFLLVFIAAQWAYGLVYRRYVTPAVITAVIVAVSFGLSWVSWVDETGEKVDIAMVQGNIEQSLRWDPEQDRITIKKYFDLTEPHWSADVIIWPEAAVPSLEGLPAGFETLSQLDEKATLNNTGLITGTVDYSPISGEAYNYLLSVGIDKNNENTIPYGHKHENRFAKHQLLPIGEFVPFEDLLRPLAPIFDLPMSSFSRGNFVQDNLISNGIHFVPAICYEIAFPNQIAANIFEHSDVIVTVSNDAWFGNSHGPHQHLQIAQVRAMEFGLPLVRATNTGITAAFDHLGNEIARFPQFESGALRFDVFLTSGLTPYRIMGNWLLFIGIILYIALVIIRNYTNKSK